MNEENKLIQFIKILWEKTISPSLDYILKQRKEDSDRIVKAIEEKKNSTDISVNNPEDISSPIVEAQRETTQAIREIPQPLPVDLSELSQKMIDLKTAIEKKEMSVNVGKTKVEVDMKSVVKAIEKLQLTIPEMKPQDQIDYTMMFDEMMKIMERPQDHSEMIKLQELVKKLGTTEDLSIIAEWLRAIAEKEYPQFPDLPRDKNGIPYFTPTKVGGGGGGGLTQVESESLQAVATEETLQKIAGFNIPAYDTQIIDETNAPATTVITFQKDGETVATQTITVSGAITTITVT